MKQNKDNIIRIDVDNAWSTLYKRLDEDDLLIDSPRRKWKIPLQWAAIAAAICAGFIFSVFYFSQGKAQPMVFLQNTENSGALVTTLADGSTVYLATNASISYPSVFAADKRKVKLNGNALFCVAKDKQRPFVIETKNKITIEVVGTIFAVQSSLGKPCELSVKQGKVNVHSQAESTTFSVEAGETVRLNSGGMSRLKTNNTQIFNLFTDKMCFKDEKLSNIVQAINTMYGRPMIITDESINNRTLTVTFENDSVETMTRLICMALNLEQINKQDTILIRQ
jgi:ferric-dicitrate binding protein FerR (iron transport regulator)